MASKEALRLSFFYSISCSRPSTHLIKTLSKFHKMSHEVDEEKQLKDALAKLQSQIEEQKGLVEKLLQIKQSKLLNMNTNESINVNPATKKAENNNHKVTTGKITKPRNPTTNISTNATIQSENLLTKKLTKLPPQKTQNIPEEPDLRNPFIKKIALNRVYHRGLNRLFLSGYKFVMIHNGRCLSLVSTNNEITKKALRNAYEMPPFLTYKGKNYIKQPNGNYHLETPAAMYVNCNAEIFSKPLTESLDLILTKLGTLRNLHNSYHDSKKDRVSCKYYTSKGVCPQPYCIYKHDPEHIALCPTMQTNSAHKCLNKVCHYSHNPTQYNSPSCKFYQLDQCENDNCIFTHKKENPSAPICRPFACTGYCDDGLSCRFTHSFQCPDVKEYGRCLDPHKCTCLHNSNMMERNEIEHSKLTLRNKDNDNVIQIVYDKNDASEDESRKRKFENEGGGTSGSGSGSESEEDNVEFIMGPVGNELNSNADFVRFQ